MQSLLSRAYEERNRLTSEYTDAPPEQRESIVRRIIVWGGVLRTLSAGRDLAGYAAHKAAVAEDVAAAWREVSAWLSRQ